MPVVWGPGFKLWKNEPLCPVCTSVEGSVEETEVELQLVPVISIITANSGVLRSQASHATIIY